MSATKQNNPNNGALICFDNNEFDDEILTHSYYKCENSFGYEYNLNRTGNYTFINLGDGIDIAYGSINFPNIFLIGQDKKDIFGGKKMISLYFKK